jgi:hypothetical protein
MRLSRVSGQPLIIERFGRPVYIRAEAGDVGAGNSASIGRRKPASLEYHRPAKF